MAILHCFVSSAPAIVISSKVNRERRVDAARRFADLIRVGIRSGKGSGPLVESELQAVYHTSRNTVRAALDLLRQEGLVERVPGVGTFAVVRQSRHVIDRLQGLSEGIERGGSRVVHEPMAIEIGPAPAIVAAVLGLEPGADALLIERRSFIDGDPVAVGSHWLPPWAEEAIRDGDLTRELFSVYEEAFGQAVLASQAVIEAVAADAWTADQLRITEGAPLLRFERRVTCDSWTIEFGFMRCRGDRLALAATLSRITPRSTAEDANQ